MCLCVRICVYICAYTCRCVCMFTHRYTHIYKHIYLHAYRYPQTNLHPYVHTDAYKSPNDEHIGYCSVFLCYKFCLNTHLIQYPPLFMGKMFQNLLWMSEATDSAEHSAYVTMFFPMQTYQNKVACVN